MKIETGKAYDVWAVIKDAGGTAGVLPVEAKLRAEGYSVLLIANGVAVGLLTKAGRTDFLAYDSAEAVLAENPAPKALISSMCSQGGVGRDLVPILRQQHVTTFALQDIWWGAHWTHWRDLEYRPHYVCVNDKLGVSVVRAAWPEFPPERIPTTGYPALDRLASYDAAAAAAMARSTLGLVKGRPVVLFGGQVKRTGEALAEVVATLNEIGKDVYLIPRGHPRMKTEAPEELPRWERSLADFRAGTLVRDSSGCDNESLIACATVTISMFSTVLVEAAAMRRQAIAVLYPDVGLASFHEETDGCMEKFPLVELGCARNAGNRDELRSALAAAYEHGLGLEAAQARTFRLDGQNAARVVQRMSALLGAYIQRGAAS